MLVFLLKISYSQVVLVVILKCYFEKIWSQNLKFSKLKFGTWVPSYMLITILTGFFSNLLSYSSWANIVQEYDVLQIN